MAAIAERVPASVTGEVNISRETNPAKWATEQRVKNESSDERPRDPPVDPGGDGPDHPADEDGMRGRFACLEWYSEIWHQRRFEKRGDGGTMTVGAIPVAPFAAAGHCPARGAPGCPCGDGKEVLGQ